MAKMERSNADTPLEEKRELLTRALERRKSASRQLSYGQEALWFDEQRAAGSPVYNISVAIRILSPLDIPSLRHAVELLVNRHDQLRTRFPSIAGIPHPVTETKVPNVFQAISLDKAAEDKLGAQANQEAQRPFDLENGPLVRVRLYSYAESDHILLLVVHHMVADGWSIWLLLDELQATYSARTDGHSEPLSPPEFNYDDFVAWQRKMVSENKWRKHRQFWSSQFADEQQPLELPLDRPRPPVLTFNGSIIRFTLDPDMVRKIRQLSRDNGFTPASLLMTVFQVLLYRLTRQESFFVGLPCFGRGLSGFSDIVGYFVNPLPLLARPNGKTAFIDLVRQVQRSTQEALVHQDYPLPLMIRDLPYERDPSLPPLFETAFVYHKPQRREMQVIESSVENQTSYWGVWTLAPFELDRVTSVYSLSLQIIELGSVLSAEMEYSTDLFNEETAQLFAVYYQRLLDGALNNPKRVIDLLPMLTVDQRRRLLFDWNDTQIKRPGNVGIHQLFEEQVLRTPNEIAVTYQETSWSYQDIDLRANLLAQYLLERGIKLGDIVGVHMPRSADYVATVLSILKVGAAFLPLSITLPLARVVYMVSDSGADLVITENEDLFIDSKARTKIVNWAEIKSKLTAETTVNLAVAITDNLPAYVLYTSGSSGRPKGVMVSHGSVTNLLADLGRRMGVKPEDVWFAQSAITFDATIVEMFLPLSVGSSLCIASQEDMIDGSRLVKTLDLSHATHTISVPTFWDLVLAAGWQGGLSIKAICGGEYLLRPLVDQLADKGVEVFNAYGNTETTVICTIQSVTKGSEVITVGRPMENAAIYILDGQMEPAPVGVPGEIYIGGFPVSLGYINRPRLTAEQFVPEPFSSIPGARLYRTGDLGRYRSDGSIEFLGRLDQQVKIRGYRVEPGEIEDRLSGHSKVRASVVIARERRHGEMQLAAFVQPESGQCVTRGELEKYLRAELPSYMVPASIGIVDALPRTPSGKIDRRGLPDLASDKLVERQQFRAPRSEFEQIVARLMAEVLDLDQVGIDDDFFELGGHSLLAVRLLALIQVETNQQLTMSNFLKYPTVRQSAALLSGLLEKSTGVELSIPRRTVAEVGSLYPLTQGQMALWYTDQLTPDKAIFNLPSIWRIEGSLNQHALEQALRTLLIRHDLLLSRIKVANEPMWELCPPEAFCIETSDLSHLERGQREKLILEMVQELALRSFDLLVEIPFRAAVISLDAEDHVIALVGHHIALDGWSIGIIKDELNQLYTAFDRDQSIDLPLPDIRFSDYAFWHREVGQGGQYDNELAFWRERLKDLPQLTLAQARKPSRRLQTNAGIIQHALPRALILELKQVGYTQNASLFTTLLAAYVVWLNRHSLQNEFGVGFPVSGRLQPETGRLVGYIVNILVLRARVDDSLTFKEFLDQVRYELLEALNNQSVPYEKVVEVVRPRRTAGQNPLFQVLFTTEMESPAILRLGDAVATEIRNVIPPAQFDLVMNIVQESDGMRMDLIYDRALFNRDELELMAQHFLMLLKNLVTDARTPISQLKLMSEMELKRALFEWNTTGEEFSRHKCVHQLYEMQVSNNPDAPAVVSIAESWNYGRLNGRTNQLARHLTKLGIEPGDIVGVDLPRTVDLVAAMLAIFKVGGIYLPLDRNLPEARLLFMIADSGTVGVISDRNQPWRTGDPSLVVCNIKDDAGKINEYSCENLSSPVRSEDPVSVIYTSGSSGQPKGALVSHRSVVNVLNDKRKRLKAIPNDVMLSHLNVSFDASLAEILMPLSAGASLYLASKEISVDPYTLIEALERSSATMMHATPDMWRVLLESDRWDGSRLKVFCGGQKLHRSVAGEIIKRGVYLINAYGPTEATIMSTGSLVTTDEDDVSIGRPVDNVTIYLLDKAMQPVPIGVPGEIYIGGESLAYGYINRACLTAERFVPDPFSGNLGARLYRSGDLARYRPDGNIEFIGRLDRQVKIRGYRIELGEIESVLYQHQKIDQVTVEVKRASENDSRLAAYIVPKAGMTITNPELRAYLEQYLPVYMIPSAFVTLDKLPLTSNLKVNREALPEPIWGQRIDSELKITPSEPTEQKLAVIWTELLKVPEIGMNDSFFDLGGHSLLVIQMMNRIEAEFGHRLPLASFVMDPSINNLAAELKTGQASIQSRSLVSLRVEGDAPPLFVVTAGYDDLLTLNRLSSAMKPGRPIYLLQPASEGYPPNLDRSLNWLLQSYLEAIHSKQATGPYRLAGFCSGGLVAFALAKRFLDVGQEVEHLILMDTPLSYSRMRHAFHRVSRWLLARVVSSDSPGLPRRTAISGPLFSDAGLVIHLNALSGYRVTSYPNEITLIVAEESYDRPDTYTRRWQEATGGLVESYVVPGGHNTFAGGERAAFIAAMLDSILD